MFCQLYLCHDWQTGWLIFGINSVYSKNHLQFVAFGPPCLLKSADRLVKSTVLNRLQLDVWDLWVFGIAYLNIALFEMALTQFCLHVLHMWKD